MRELSLFTGAGGGLLGTKLLGWTPIGYVEKDEYCQRVLAQRIKDGYLEEAPIFTDIRAFNDSGCAELYRGVADVITAGFPCQPFSCAGKRKGEDDDRNMWPETLECIRQVKPRFVFLENVPGLFISPKRTLYRFVRTRSSWIPYPVPTRFTPYFGRILGDLAASGFDVRWRVLSAGEVGAPHKRDRVWILAHARRGGPRGVQPIAHEGGREQTHPIHRGENVPHANRPVEGRREFTERGQEGRDTDVARNGSKGDVADADGTGPQGPSRGEFRSVRGAEEKPEGRQSCGGTTAEGNWWTTEPSLGRVADGVADRVGQLRALGNGQVPSVVATAWRLLTENFEQEEAE